MNMQNKNSRNNKSRTDRHSLPGADAFDDQLVSEIKAVRETRGSAYKPRTRHLLPNGEPVYTNRLFLESSPYLLQHAHNPVNWYPWGDEAFDTAAQHNRPVLVSIGYSTCHWCHVMEEESFEDEAIAEYLNEHYIAVKVDREERPDVDAVYMSAVQALTGGGGWPLNVFLTPDRKPFYGGTYFPARDGDRGNATGFLTLLEKINESYHAKKEVILSTGQQLTGIVRQTLTPEHGRMIPEKNLMSLAMNFYKKHYDKINGGLTGAPKFPSSLPVRFLLRYYQRTGDEDALAMAVNSLDKMASGGLYDQVGGGFHRYATDEKWLVPHFEKMLYDNALLVPAYLEAYQVTGNTRFRDVAVDVLNYVDREMTSLDGVFFSATDADSLTPSGHREEGYFFTWTREEIRAVLDKEQADLVAAYYNIGKHPNFEGRYIFHTPESLSNAAKQLTISEENAQKIIHSAKQRLYDQRRQRPAPLRDEKVLTSWNGLMISAFARAGLYLRYPMYIDIAGKAARFIMENMMIQGRLRRSYNHGRAMHNAYLDDYAFFIAGLLDLFEADHDPFWLQTAVKLDDVLSAVYEDKEAGGFFMTADDHELLIARQKPSYDGAEPSGNSVAALNLLRLGTLTSKETYRLRGEKALKAFLGSPSSNPVAMSEMMLALDFYLD